MEVPRQTPIAIRIRNHMSWAGDLVEYVWDQLHRLTVLKRNERDQHANSLTFHGPAILAHSPPPSSVVHKPTKK